MRSLLIFLLGIIVGVGGMLFLPELTSRREQLSEETKKHLEILEGQVRDLGDQLKKINPPKPGDDQSKQPSATPSTAAHLRPGLASSGPKLQSPLVGNVQRPTTTGSV
jgi:hypothetical protein